LSGEADNVANIVEHAARPARLDLASFPTVNNASAATIPDTQLAMAPLLDQLIAIVNDLGASITFLTSQVENLTSAQAGCSATVSQPAISNLEVSLKDLSSHVAALSFPRAIQVAPATTRPSSTHPCSPNQTYSAEEETRYLPLISYCHRPRFSLPF